MAGDASADSGAHAGANAGGNGHSGLPEALPEITDEVVERLFRSLDIMEADYQATLAAERQRQPCEEPRPLNAEGSLAEEDDGAESVGGGGYAALGSDDGGSGSDHEEAFGSHPATVDDEGDWGSFQSSKREAFDPPSRAVQAEAPGLPGSTEAEASPWSAASGVTTQEFEDFADFGPSNPALPAAPPELPVLQVKPLSADEVKLIKNTMREVRPNPPAWAQRLSDADLSRMVKELLRST
eukprot:TRINITY_DN51421_c0_g1_i1.p1 TRINITY_DN51421_c0_g1~~TRINITY_DN51421_c0_g1_i1.p1  ORF type:complete len:252 (+),score=69.16 TRINITY_DN51421_c0_g1_i1:39-758(+)